MSPDYVIYYNDYAKPIERFKELLRVVETILTNSKKFALAPEIFTPLQVIYEQMKEFKKTNFETIDTLLAQIKTLQDQLNALLRDHSSSSCLSSASSVPKQTVSRGLWFIRFTRRPPPPPPTKLDTIQAKHEQRYDAIESLTQRITSLKIQVIKFHPTMLKFCADAEGLLTQISPDIMTLLPSGGDYRLALT